MRATRLRAGLSQAELARRAGIPRSVLNAYERGHRDPGAEAMSRVLGAAGFELRALPAVHRPDPQRAARILGEVLDLAESLPFKGRGPLEYPPLRRRVA